MRDNPAAAVKETVAAGGRVGSGSGSRAAVAKVDPVVRLREEDAARRVALAALRRAFQLVDAAARRSHSSACVYCVERRQLAWEMQENPHAVTQSRLLVRACESLREVVKLPSVWLKMFLESQADPNNRGLTQGEFVSFARASGLKVVYGGLGQDEKLLESLYSFLSGRASMTGPLANALRYNRLLFKSIACCEKVRREGGVNEYCV
jgi:hypothetical protein